MRAIVVGATGAVGRDLVEALCADPRYTEVRTFTRRELGVDDPKLRPYVVDFERTEGWHDLVQGDVIFSALGTSKKQAGSKEAQYHIDHDYQLRFATFAKQNGVRHMVLVSSAGADTGSSFFYMKLKGVIERDVEALGFAGLTIVQPPSLIRKHAKRPLETIFCQGPPGAQCHWPLQEHGSHLDGDRRAVHGRSGGRALRGCAAYQQAGHPPLRPVEIK